MTIKTCLECGSLEGTPHQPRCVLGQRAEREKHIQLGRDLIARRSVRGARFKVLEALLAEVDELTDAMTEVPKPIPAEETARAIALLARQLDPTSVLFTAEPRDRLTEEQFVDAIGEMLQGWGYAKVLESAVRELQVPHHRTLAEVAAEEQDLEPEAVDGPSHYGGKGNDYEAIVVMVEWFGPDATAAFCRLNAVKYLQRAGSKFHGDQEPMDVLREDLKKAAWYCETAARILETGKAR